MLATNNQLSTISKIIDDMLAKKTAYEPIFIVNQINWLDYENVLLYLGDSPFLVLQ